MEHFRISRIPRSSRLSILATSLNPQPFAPSYRRRPPLGEDPGALELEARGYGYVIGYNYHGGHANTPWPAASGSSARWISPQRLTDQSRRVLISDMNDWGVGRCFAPRGKNGPIMTGEDASNEDPGSRSSAGIGAAGGNLGLLDGSVSWKTVKQMQAHRGSQSWEAVCTAMW